MRILLVNHTARAHTGGLNRMVVETCGLLVSARHSVALAFNDGGASEVACPTFALPADDAPDAAMRAAFEDVLQKFQPEVVQLHGADHAFFRTEIARRVPTCRFIHDQSLFCSGGDRMSGDFAPCHRAHGTACLALHYATRCGGKNPFGNWERWRRVQRRCEMKNEPRLRLQVASEFMRRGLLENGYDAERIDVVPLFAIPPNTPPQTEPDLLLVASRLVKAKGVHLLLRALATIADAPWRLVVAGTGPEFSALQNLAHELALRERVRFTGELTPRELDAWYARAAIVVSPVLRPEPFGLVGIEAMVRGRPVVAFAGGATEEWLTDGETGIAVREHSHAALAGAIASLMRDAIRRGRMGAGALARSGAFAPEKFVERLVLSCGRCVGEFPR